MHTSLRHILNVKESSKMDKLAYEYLGTTLEEIRFNKSVLKNEFEIKLKVVQKNDIKDKICIIGKMDILNNSTINGSIEMHSVFREVNNNVTERIKLLNLNSTEQTYFVKPVLSELSLLLSILSQKAVRLPLNLSVENLNVVSIDYEDYDLDSQRQSYRKCDRE